VGLEDRDADDDVAVERGLRDADAIHDECVGDLHVHGNVRVQVAKLDAEALRSFGHAG